MLRSWGKDFPTPQRRKLCQAPGCAVKGVSVLRVRVSSEELSVRLGSYGDGWFGQPADRSSPDKSPVLLGCKPAGRNVSELWKVPERLLWRPTCPGRGEGCQVGDFQPTHDRLPSAGEMETACWEKRLSQHGRSSPVDPCQIQRFLGNAAGLGVGGAHST